MPNKILLMTAMMFAAGLLLTACDQAEQGRVLLYKKGTYLGQADTEISEETRNSLRGRMEMQSGN